MTFNGRQGHLATITSEAEIDCALAARSTGTTVWVAGRNAGSGDVFYWKSGPEVGQVVDDNFLYLPYHDDDVYDFLGCLKMTGEKLDPVSCSSTANYLVEYECAPTPEAAGPCARKLLLLLAPFWASYTS